MTRRPMRRSSFFLTAGLAAPVLVAGCGVVTAGGAFDARFPDNQPEPTAAVVSKLPEPQAPEATADRGIAVGTTEGEPRSVVAFDLGSGETLWSRELPAMTRPAALGDVVVTSTRDEVVALDLDSGRELWRRSVEGQAFVGADRTKDVIVFATNVGAAGGEVRESHVVAVDARSGRGKWDHRLSAVLGRPAARGPYVFVPWDRQNIAVLEAASGDETARLRSTDDIIDWVTARPAGVYYGSRSIYRLTEDAYKGTRAETVYREPPIPEAPREPLVEDDAFYPDPGMRSARGKIRIYFEPKPGEGALGEPIGVVGDTFYYVYFRYVYAFDGNDRLRWATMLPETVLAAQPLEEGLLVVTETGAVRVLGLDDGDEVWSRELDATLASLSLDAASFDPPGLDAAAGALSPAAEPTAGGEAPVAAAGDEATTDGDAPSGGEAAADADAEAAEGEATPEEATAETSAPVTESTGGADAAADGVVAPGSSPAVLRESLIRIATDPDNRLVPGRAFAIALLARLDIPEVTRDLLDLYAQRSMPAALRDAIVEALRTRSEGSNYLVEALDQRYDFLEGTRSPPLALIVPSLIESGATEAVPGLVAQLEDHETPLEVMPLLVEAVAKLGGETAQPTVRRFLTFYRSDSSFAEDPRALIEAVDAVFEEPGEDGRDYLQKLAAKPTTLEPVRNHIQGLFQAEAEQAANAGFEEVLEAEKETAEKQSAILANRPEKLTQAQIQAEFASNADILRECVVDEIERNPKLGQVRFVFIIDADGVPHDYAITPASEPFINCVEPVVRDFRYPEVKQKRQFATVTLQIGAGREGTVDEELRGCGENDPWWTCYRAVDSAGRPMEVSVATDARPWWTARQPPEWYVSEAERRRRLVEEATSASADCPPGMPNCAAGRTTQPDEAPPEDGDGAAAGGDEGEPAEETPWWLEASGEDGGGGDAEE